MQIYVARGVVDALTEPLLPSAQLRGEPPQGGSGGGSTGSTTSSDRAARAATRGGELLFLRRFRALLLLLRPYRALYLALLSVAEAVVVAEVGKVAGSFYKIVVDRQPSQLAAAMLHAAALYAASTALHAASCWLTEGLALRWRATLTRHLHRRYCGPDRAYYFLQRSGGAPWGPAPEPPACQPPAGPPRGQQLGVEPSQGQQEAQQEGLEGQRQEAQQEGQGQGRQEVQQEGLEWRQQQQAQRVDNADQRIAADAAQLCECLAAVAQVATAVPFKVVYYSWLTSGYLGWRGLLAVYAFFLAAALAQRLALAPVSRLVFRQELREGNLRYSHLRLREYAGEVAQYGGEGAERAHLDSALAAALANQGRLVRRRAVLAGVTRSVDYAGAMLNYLVVGAAVFAGAAGPGADSGQLAQFVSNASFAALTLIYTFTQLLDLSDQLSKLGGLTARVGQLLEVLPASRGVPDGAKTGRHDMHAVRLSMDGARELQPSRFADLVQPPRLMSCLGGTAEMEVSVHRLGPDLRHEARAIFPDAPAEGQLLACLTFQFAAGGISLAPDSSAPSLHRAAAEMDRLLDAFLRWEARVRSALAASGHWCDAVDPRSGFALHGARGARWSEVAAAHALLGYERRDAGICPVVLHPLHGASAYPVTLFTSAPPAELERALGAACDQPAPHRARLGSPLLELRQLSVRSAAGPLAVAGLDLHLWRGQHLLIAGPNGCGKSTLVRALCGLHPVEAGSIQLAAEAEGRGAMFVPQRPLAAPGAALWQQICYPNDAEDPDDGASSTTSSKGPGMRAVGRQRRRQAVDSQRRRPLDAELLALLERVGLRYLLDRVDGSFQAAADWAGQLSPGELQRLAVARVLLRRPALAVLDEPTSAVSEEAAGQLYREMQRDGITCVSVGQDSGHLRCEHTQLLRLGCNTREGGWELLQLS